MAKPTGRKRQTLPRTTDWPTLFQCNHVGLRQGLLILLIRRRPGASR